MRVLIFFLVFLVAIQVGASSFCARQSKRRCKNARVCSWHRQTCQYKICLNTPCRELTFNQCERYCSRECRCICETERDCKGTKEENCPGECCEFRDGECVAGYVK